MSGNNGWQGEPRPAFPFYASDWLVSPRVRLMTYEQRGLYIELLAYQWREGHVDDEAIADLCTCDGVASGEENFACNLEQMHKAFPVGEDGLRRNPRLERERKVLQDHAKRQQEAGKAGAEKRWRGNGVAMPDQCDPNATAMAKDSSSSSSSSLEEKKAAPPARRSSRARADPETELAGKPVWVVQVVRSWLAYRHEKGQPAYAPSGLRALVSKIESMGQVRSKAALDHSMASNYQGLFEPSAAGPRAPIGKAVNRASQPYVPDPTPSNENPPSLSELLKKAKMAP